jgi:thioredoxin-dependent peroxiredoxin
MKLLLNQTAPPFSTNDVYGNVIDLNALRGRKIYLAFERNVGCPVCNLRTHELLKHAEYFASRKILVVLVFESPSDKMLAHLGENSYPFHFVADPDNKLYDSYGVSRSFISVMRSLFNGIVQKANRGNKLFNKPMKQDGHLDRIPAEFIVDESGIIKLIHYGRFIGDHLPIGALK